MKISLSLPKIQPRPPCPPRVYQKLYRYLDSALLAGSPRRSSRTNNNFTKNKDAITAPSSSTPSKSRTPAQQSNASAGKLKRPLLRCAAVPAENGNKEDLVPQWVMPAIRVLCGKLGAPAAPPHVYAGVSSILTLPAPSKRIDECSSDGGEQVNIAAGQAKNQPTRTMKKIPALIVAVSLIVYTCLSGKSTPPAEYARQKTIGLAALRGVVPPALLATRGSAQSEHNDSNDGCNTPADVDGWLREIRDGGWTQLDWFKNVGQGTGLKVGEGGEDEEDPHGDENHEHEENSWTLRKGLEDDGEEQEYLQPGLGTMVRFILSVSQWGITYLFYIRSLLVC